MKNYPVRAELRTCLSCDFRKMVAVNHCPRCGRPLFTEDGVRKKGCFALIFGILWVLGILGLLVFVVFIYAGVDAKPKSREEVNERNTIFFTLLLTCGLLSVGGFSFILSGIWQMIFARQKHAAFLLTITVIALLLYISFYIFKVYW